MKIAIAGASGQVGQMLVPRLVNSGASLVLIGRDTEKLQALFSDQISLNYETLENADQRFDVFINLAVINNNSDENSKAFNSVNVDLPISLVKICIKCSATRFVNISSVHALDMANRTLYAVSKRRSEKIIAETESLSVKTAYLASVYADKWGGKLSILNKFPQRFSERLFASIRALKPTTHIENLVNYILDPQNQESATILTDGQSKNRFFHFVKRLFDLSVALATLFFLGWLMILIWIAVRLDSAGPGIFVQNRIGRNRKVFTCYKFRTMKLGTVSAGTHETSVSYVTRIGHFLRSTKLDELPQIFNIFKNEISLIGPRPCLPVQTCLIEARDKLGIYSLKPGISGIAQINNIDMSDPEKLAHWDEKYLKLQSLLMDVKIAVATVVGRGQGDKIASDEVG